MRFAISAAALAVACFAVPAQAADVILGFTVHATGTRTTFLTCNVPSDPCFSDTPIARDFAFNQTFHFVNGVSQYVFGNELTVGRLSFTLTATGGTNYLLTDFAYGYRSFSFVGPLPPGGYVETLTAPPLAVSSVPEPATWAMMIFGFGAIGASLRRPLKLRAASAR